MGKAGMKDPAQSERMSRQERDKKGKFTSSSKAGRGAALAGAGVAKRAVA